MPGHEAVVHITETLLTMLPIVKNDALIFPPQQAIMMARRASSIWAKLFCM